MNENYLAEVKDFVDALNAELEEKVEKDFTSKEVEEIREAIAFSVFESITKDLREIAGPDSLALAAIFIINQVLENSESLTPTEVMVKVSRTLNTHPNFNQNRYSSVIASRYQAIGEFASLKKLPNPVFLSMVNDDVNYEEQVEEMVAACERSYLLLDTVTGISREEVAFAIFTKISNDLKIIALEVEEAKIFVEIIERAEDGEPSFEEVISKVNEEVALLDELGGLDFMRVKASLVGIGKFLRG